MRLPHDLARTHASFDDPDLVSHGGLVPVMALAQRAGLADLTGDHVRPGGDCGVNAPVKIACLVAGMAGGTTASMTWTCCGMARCRACSAGSGPRPPSGSHLRAYAWGNVRQLEKAHREFLAGLAPRLGVFSGVNAKGAL